MAQEIKRATLSWQEGYRFIGGELGKPTITVDGDNEAGPGPMLTLLLAAAACSGSDVISILKKMRTEVRGFDIDIEGTRREEEPRRYVAIHLEYRLRGENIDAMKARRAIDLSLERYCSVIHSLAPDIVITYALSLA
jgi:putative redox protein